MERGYGKEDSPDGWDLGGSQRQLAATASASSVACDRISHTPHYTSHIAITLLLTHPQTHGRLAMATGHNDLKESSIKARKPKTRLNTCKQRRQNHHGENRKPNKGSDVWSWRMCKIWLSLPSYPQKSGSRVEINLICVRRMGSKAETIPKSRSTEERG